jgi:hypothetical protein
MDSAKPERTMFLFLFLFLFRLRLPPLTTTTYLTLPLSTTATSPSSKKITTKPGQRKISPTWSRRSPNALQQVGKTSVPRSAADPRPATRSSGSSSSRHQIQRSSRFFPGAYSLSNMIPLISKTRLATYAHVTESMSTVTTYGGGTLSPLSTHLMNRTRR